MLINQSNLSALFIGFKAAFQGGFSGAETHYKDIAMTVPSSTREEHYGWLGQFPGMREWLGHRIINNLELHSYAIKNKDFENTIGVPRNDIEDDRLGIFAPLFTEMGRAAAEHPDQLVFDLLKAGFATECYDGQYFFDTDHPVKNAAGEAASVSNMQAGSSTPWFLLDANRAIKPMIYQERRSYALISKTQGTDDNVFFNKEYLYGVDGRSNVGYGLWQLAFGSKATLNEENYAAARAAMMNLRGDTGRPLGIKPTVPVVPPSLEEAALRLLNSEYSEGGESNPWKGTAKPIVTVWVA